MYRIGKIQVQDMDELEHKKFYGTVKLRVLLFSVHRLHKIMLLGVLVKRKMEDTNARMVIGNLTEKR